MKQMANSGAQLGSLFGCIFEENGFAFTSTRVFLYYNVHSVECL